MANKEVIVDAAVRFRARQELSTFDTDQDELQFVRQLTAEQPGQFYRYVSEGSQALKELLKDDIEPGLSTRVVHVVDDESRSDTTEEDSNVYYYRSDSEQGSTDSSQTRKLVPRLLVSTSAVHSTHSLLAPLYATKPKAPEARRNHLEASVIATSWMALGRWAFEKMEPEDYDALDSHDTYRLLHGVAEKSCEECLEYDLDNDRERALEVVEKALLEVKYRFAGAMAYAGLVKQSEGKEVSVAPDQAELKVFQAMMGQLITERAQRVPERITATEFALSMPLSLKAAGRLIDFFMVTPESPQPVS